MCVESSSLPQLVSKAYAWIKTPMRGIIFCSSIKCPQVTIKVTVFIEGYQQELCKQYNIHQSDTTNCTVQYLYLLWTLSKSQRRWKLLQYTVVLIDGVL